MFGSTTPIVGLDVHYFYYCFTSGLEPKTPEVRRQRARPWSMTGTSLLLARTLHTRLVVYRESLVTTRATRETTTQEAQVTSAI